MQPSISSPSAQPQHRYPAPHGDLRRGSLAGLIPLLRLIVMLAVAVALPLIARLVTGAQTFATQQSAVVIAFAVGLVLAAVVYTASLVGVFRRLRTWREDGRDVSATAALWMLAVTALIVALPVIVAAVLPQHPAP
jgi:uncharacterized membrane protein YidH (DUF202 family)